jgi:hypothetical protein
MNAKVIVAVVLLLFVGLSLTYLVIKETGKQSVAETEAVPVSAITESSESVGHQVIAYYFHGQRRCPSCIKIEAYSKETVDSLFQDALRDGRLVWRVVNFEESGNEHYSEDYKLIAQSLIIVDRHNGEQTAWKNLDKVWELLGDKQAFMSYVYEEITSYLDET